MSLAVEIRENDLYFVKGKVKKGSYKVDNYFKVSLPEPFFDNEKINQSPENFETINKVLKEHKIAKGKVNIVLNNNKILTRNLTLPKIESKKLQFVVKSEMKRIFNLSNEYIIDYEVQDEIEDFEGNKLNIVASAMHQNIIKELEGYFNDFKLKINCIESATSSLLRVFSSFDFFSTTSPVVVIEKTDDYFRYYVYNDYMLVFTRNIALSTFENDNEVIERVIELLENTNQFLVGKFGNTFDELICIGDVDFFENNKEIIINEFKVEYNCINLELAFKNNVKELTEYINVVGGLV